MLVSLCLFLSFYLFFFVPVLFSWWIPSQVGSRKISTGNMSLKPSWTLSPREEKPKCFFSWKNFGWLCLSQIRSLDQSLWCGDDTSGCWGTMSCWLYRTVWHSTRTDPAGKRDAGQTRTRHQLLLGWPKDLQVSFRSLRDKVEVCHPQVLFIFLQTPLHSSSGFICYTLQT